MRRQWFLAPFKHLLHDPRLWGVRRRTVVPAFALGLFVCYMPFPGHMLTAALLALALGINIPVASITTLVSNPLTIGPMFYVAYELGRKILDAPARAFEFDLSFAWLLQRFVEIWQPMLIGCAILGAGMSLVGYVALDFLWRASISDYLDRRRERRRLRSGKR